MTAELSGNPECIHYFKYIYYGEDGKQRHTNTCKIMDYSNVKTTCVSLRRSRRCPRDRAERREKHHHEGKQLFIGGYR